MKCLALIRRAVLRTALPLAAVGCLLGCGDAGPKVYPVAGRIELKGGDVKLLAKSAVELTGVDDPDSRAFGQIQPDGRFKLQCLHEGELVKGVKPGKYVARILPNDEDDATLKRATQAVAARYLKFETAKLPVQVPAPAEVKLSISAR